MPRHFVDGIEFNSYFAVQIQDFLLHFWQAMPSHMVSVLGCDVVIDLIAVCDITLYNVIILVLFPLSLLCRVIMCLNLDSDRSAYSGHIAGIARDVSVASGYRLGWIAFDLELCLGFRLSHEINQITKQLGIWLTSSTRGLPEKLRERKLAGVCV